MRFLDQLFEKFKHNAQFKFDYEIAPFFHMTPDSFRGTTRKRRIDMKKTCIMLWKRTGFLSEVTICEKCGEYIPDEECLENLESEGVFFCPCCDAQLPD